MSAGESFRHQLKLTLQQRAVMLHARYVHSAMHAQPRLHRFAVPRVQLLSFSVGR